MKKFLSVVIAAFFAVGFCFCQDFYESKKDKSVLKNLQDAFLKKDEKIATEILENSFIGNRNSSLLEENSETNENPVSILDLAESSGSEELQNLVYEKSYRSLTYNLFNEYIGKHDDFLRYALSKFKNINSVSDNEFLEESLKSGNFETIDFLLANGVQPSNNHIILGLCNRGGFYKNVPLETKKQVIDLLQKNGDEIKKNNHELIEAVIYQTGDQDLLIYLLENGMSAKSFDKKSPDQYLELSFNRLNFKGDEKGIYAFSLLLKNGAKISNNTSGINTLELASIYDVGDGKFVQLALKKGAKFNKINNVQDDSPIIHVMDSGNLPALKILYNAKANFKTADVFMNCARYCKSLECMEFYLEKTGFNEKTTDSQGHNPFWKACEKGNDLMISYFLEKGADPNSVENGSLKNGLMAYFENQRHYGKGAPETKVLNLILNSGIDLSHKDSKGRTALDYAKPALSTPSEKDVLKGWEEAIALVQKKSEKLENSAEASESNGIESLFDAVISKDNAKLSDLLKNPEIRKTINQKDSGGLSAMDYAVHMENAQAVKILLQNGSDISNESLKSAVETNSDALLKVIFENSSTINRDLWKNENDLPDLDMPLTPLYLALRQFNDSQGDEKYKNAETLLTVINAGPDWNITFGHSGFLKNLWKADADKTIIRIAKAAIEKGEDPFENKNEFIEKLLNLSYSNYSEDEMEFIKYFLYKNDNYKKLLDKNGKYKLSDKYDSNRINFEKLVLEKLLNGKTMTVTENLNLRINENHYTKVMGTLKAGTKVCITGIQPRKEEIDGIIAFWVDVALESDTVTINGEKLKARTKGFCFSAYLQQ